LLQTVSSTHWQHSQDNACIPDRSCQPDQDSSSASVNAFRPSTCAGPGNKVLRRLDLSLDSFQTPTSKFSAQHIPAWLLVISKHFLPTPPSFTLASPLPSAERAKILPANQQLSFRLVW